VRRGGAAPWKREKDETATSPVSGESGWLLELYLEASCSALREEFGQLDVLLVFI
jgi:hypothetical protein